MFVGEVRRVQHEVGVAQVRAAEEAPVANPQTERPDRKPYGDVELVADARSGADEVVRLAAGRTERRLTDAVFDPYSK